MLKNKIWTMPSKLDRIKSMLNHMQVRWKYDQDFGSFESMFMSILTIKNIPTLKDGTTNYFGRTSTLNEVGLDLQQIMLKDSP